MSYSTDIATILAKQLTKFAALNRHQLIGQVENLDFWLNETQNCLRVLDGYNTRFELMKAAQTKYVSEHNTIEFFPDATDRQWTASRPTRIPRGEFQDARRSLCDAAYRFLVRCHNEKFIDEVRLRKHCDVLQIGIEASDLKDLTKK